MHVINPSDASTYLDSIDDDRQRSAALAIHLAWLERSSGIDGTGGFQPDAPLDMLVLYRAAAAAFRDWPPAEVQLGDLPAGGRVLNRERACALLRSFHDGESARLATHFARSVVVSSAHAAGEQDLLYCVELFLYFARHQAVIDQIISGAITRDSKRLADPDCW